MIERVDEGKQAYLPLLLLADEQEDMIERYLDRGALYVLRENDMILAVCVVTEEGGGIFEVKNLAVAPEHQRKGGGPGYAGFCAGTLSGLRPLPAGRYRRKSADGPVLSALRLCLFPPYSGFFHAVL